MEGIAKPVGELLDVGKVTQEEYCVVVVCPTSRYTEGKGALTPTPTELAKDLLNVTQGRECVRNVLE